MASQDIIRPAVHAEPDRVADDRAATALARAGEARFEVGSSAVELKVSLIDVVNRLRPVNAGAVADLVVSLGESVLAHPITVRPVNGRFELVVGAHRLAAFCELRKNTIPAVIRHMSALEARQLEIDENLIRSELTALDRLTFLAERVEVWAARNPEKIALDASRPLRERGRPPKHFLKLRKVDGYVPSLMGFATETARDTGLSMRTVYQSVQALAALPQDQRDRLQGTWVARNDSALRQLAGIGDAVEQAKVIDLLLDGATKSIPDARALAAGNRPAVKTPSDTVQRDFEKAWKAATPSQRDGLLHWLSGQPLPKGWDVSKGGAR